MILSSKAMIFFSFFSLVLIKFIRMMVSSSNGKDVAFFHSSFEACNYDYFLFFSFFFLLTEYKIKKEGKIYKKYVEKL